MADIITNPISFSGSQAINLTAATFTPGAALALDSAAQIINATWNLGNTKYAAFETKVEAVGAQIQALLDGLAFHIASAQSAVPTVTDPGVTIPTNIDSAVVMASFDSEVTTQVGVLATKVVSFISTYFPNEGEVYAKAETWLNGALSNPNGGLPTAVQAQITTDDQARILADAARASDSVLQTFAARRFPLPPGAAASAILQIQQKAQDGMAESSRKITIASIEQMKFAIEKTIGLRQMAFGATMDYVKTLSAGQGVAGAVIPAAYDAQSKLIGAAAGYYGARSEAAKVVASVNEFNASQTQGAAEKNQVADLTLVEDKVKALMVEVQAIAQMTTSLFNNVHASSGSSYSVSA